jgi:hypothetical protein
MGGYFNVSRCSIRTYKLLFRTSQETHYVFATISWLMFFMEIIAVIVKTMRNTFCGQKAEASMLKQVVHIVTAGP